MTGSLTREDAEKLLAIPEFKRFLFAAIQRAGCLSHEGSAHGHEQRDFNEGRRSLGFDLLMMVHAGQPDAILSQDTTAITTLHALLVEVMQTPKEKPNVRRDDTRRYRDLDD